MDMTELELKHLRRADLVEILLDLSKENEILRAQLERARTQLADRTIAVENAGSLAEAALRLNGVFEAAQAACDQYTQNLRQRMAEQDEICRRMEQEAQKKCDQMLEEAKAQADAYRKEAEQAVQEMVNSYSWLSKVLN